MKKILFFVGMFNSINFTYADEVLAEKKVADDKSVITQNGEDFQEFGEPTKTISGAYWGLGLGLSRTQHKIEFTENNSSKTSKSSSAAQVEASILLGFGTAFYKRYYAGLEVEVFNRFKGSNKNIDNKLNINHCRNMSLNFDTRFGYLFPKSGNLIFITAGVSRLFGRVSFGDDKKNESSFGSFFPTVGFGFEHRINYNWNVRADYHYVISSKDNEHEVTANGNKYKYQGKANRMGIRLSFIRNINSSLF